MMRARLLGVLVFVLGCGANNGVTGTVDPGSNLVAPDLPLDEAFFYCRIEPDVIQQHHCASGDSGESGMCHDSRSALRLIASDDPAPCDASNKVNATVPDAYSANLEAVRFFVQADPLTSPFYLRPLDLASHPRQIFNEQDPAAKLIEEWISAGAN
jgi:hypothetical protein